MDTASAPFFLKAPAFFMKEVTAKVLKKALAVEERTLSQADACRKTCD